MTCVATGTGSADKVATAPFFACLPLEDIIFVFITFPLVFGTFATFAGTAVKSLFVRETLTVSRGGFDQNMQVGSRLLLQGCGFTYLLLHPMLNRVLVSQSNKTPPPLEPVLRRQNLCVRHELVFSRDRGATDETNPCMNERDSTCNYQ